MSGDAPARLLRAPAPSLRQDGTAQSRCFCAHRKCAVSASSIEELNEAVQAKLALPCPVCVLLLDEDFDEFVLVTKLVSRWPPPHRSRSMLPPTGGIFSPPRSLAPTCGD